jgi:DNA-binding MarR family transcriptional regulator
MSTLSKTKKKRFDSAAQEVYLSLWRTYDRLRAIEDELFSTLDLTAQQYNVLRLLQAAAPALVPTLQISSKMISRAPDITRMLDKLQERELIERTRSDEDRRAVLIGITPKGTELLSDLADKVKKTHVAQVGHLSVEEMRALCELLARVRDPHEPDGSDWKPKS